ncbi:MAG: UvrD-helicase domain-containing protein [bacterium]|nr:UvrD-helicase domain-containing protein [bacterium]
MSYDFDLKLLNASQRRAVTLPPGPALVIAGAGSGKTRVITYRIWYLLTELGMESSSILGVTFTNKAAGEMRDRVAANMSYGARVNLGTFHGICAKILKREATSCRADKNFSIFDAGDSRAAIKRIVRDFGLPTEQFNQRAIAARISRYKNDLIVPDDAPTDDYYEGIVAEIYRHYQELLEDNNAYDFGDLIMETVKLFRENENVLSTYQDLYEQVLVDEYQDTNRAQYALIYSLCRTHENVMVVGDPDQSIYRWRGAEVGNFKNFVEAFPDAAILNLEQNYRSHQGILTVANSLIRYNTSYQGDKELWSDRGEEVKPKVYRCDDERFEALKVLAEIEELRANYGMSYGDFAILYRVNAQSRIFEEEFTAKGIPFKVVGGTRFYERKEVKDAVAYLRSVHSIRDSVSFSRIINVPPRGIGKKSLAIIEANRGRRSLQQTAADPEIQSSLPKKAAKSVKSLTNLLQQLRDKQGAGPAELINELVEEAGYLSYLEEERDIQGIARADNVKELIAAAFDFEEVYPEGDVGDFLESVTLVQDADGIDESEAVKLMTLHTAKGLEFPAVFIVGLEQRLLPHINSMGSTEEVEEERRLCYVGITRAMDFLTLTYCVERSVRGISEVRDPSRFLREIATSGIEFEELTTPREPELSEYNPWVPRS